MTEDELIELILQSNVPMFDIKSSDKDLYPYVKHTVECSKHTEFPSDLYIECGVFTGNTFAMIRGVLSDSIKLYGFDTFTGLTEPWVDGDTGSVIYNEGAFGLNYIPHTPHGCEFVIGDVRETLNDFLNTHLGNIRYVHFDMDLYDPTKYALEVMKTRFTSGTVLVFDDFYNLPGWRHHSFKAMQEMIDVLPFTVKPLATVGWNAGWASVAFILD